MKKIIFLLVVSALVTLLEPAMAQRRRSGFKRNIPIWYRSRFYSTVGLGFGSANYFGDVTPTPSALSTDIKTTRSSINAFATHKFASHLTGRASLSWHRLKGDDFVSADPNQKNAIGRYIRNLHFRNDVVELTATAAYDFIGSSDAFFKRSLWSPYVFGGLGIVYHNPKARIPSENGNGDWVALRPLRTEGNSYSRVTLAIPVGLGVNYKLSQRLDIGFEAGYRYTLTDYLDDVSKTYVDPASLSSDLARTMANRTLEQSAADAGGSREQGLRNIAKSDYGFAGADLPGYNPFDPSTTVLGTPTGGTIRGAGKGKDWYLVTGFHVKYILINVAQRPRFR